MNKIKEMMYVSIDIQDDNLVEINNLIKMGWQPYYNPIMVEMSDNFKTTDLVMMLMVRYE